MKAKKYLSFSALRQMISDKARALPDYRRKNSIIHSVHDAVMSALACMYSQEPSLLQFQTDMAQSVQKKNIRTLFGVQKVPSSNTIKDVLDSQDSGYFNNFFRDIIRRLNRGKQLDQFNFLPGQKICSIDATHYHCSESIRCPQCLTKHKDNPDKPTVYQHAALQAVLMHPDMKPVIPIIAESIRNGDGAIKQDCEINAAKRFIPELRKMFPRMELIITGDDLFSRQPMIETVLANNFHFFFVAKPTSHKFMMQEIRTQGLLNETVEVDEKNRTITIYQWANGVPLCGSKDAIKVNYFSKKIITLNGLYQYEHCHTESWVTDLKVTAENIALFVRGAKCRWKIENECFNTLKNQGYHLKHNYGHGEKYLAFNVYLLTLLAFTLHQVAELCDTAFKACRKIAGSKRSLWEKLRTIINIAVFESMEKLFDYFINRTFYDFIGGYAVNRAPP